MKDDFREMMIWSIIAEQVVHLMGPVDESTDPAELVDGLVKMTGVSGADILEATEAVHLRYNQGEPH